MAISPARRRPSCGAACSRSCPRHRALPDPAPHGNDGRTIAPGRNPRHCRASAASLCHAGSSTVGGAPPDCPASRPGALTHATRHGATWPGCAWRRARRPSQRRSMSRAPCPTSGPGRSRRSPGRAYEARRASSPRRRTRWTTAPRTFDASPRVPAPGRRMAATLRGPRSGPGPGPTRASPCVSVRPACLSSRRRASAVSPTVPRALPWVSRPRGRPRAQRRAPRCRSTDGSATRQRAVVGSRTRGRPVSRVRPAQAAPRAPTWARPVPSPGPGPVRGAAAPPPVTRPRPRATLSVGAPAARPRAVGPSLLERPPQGARRHPRAAAA